MRNLRDMIIFVLVFPLIKTSGIVGLPKQQLLRSIDRDIYVLITNLIILIVCCNVIQKITKEEGNVILLINCYG